MANIYTENAEIIRGSRWPPGRGFAKVTITYDTGWQGNEGTAWDWGMEFWRRGRSAPDLTVTAYTAYATGGAGWPKDSVVSKYYATAGQTTNLPEPSDGRFEIEVFVLDDSGDKSYYDVAAGIADVRDPGGG